MYDNIRCSAPLPGVPPAYLRPGHWFQTKNLECALQHYEITADGKLVQLTEMGMGWQEQDLSPPRQLTDYHADLHFYASNGGTGWIEYRARFTDGGLSAVTEVRRERC